MDLLLPMLLSLQQLDDKLAEIGQKKKEIPERIRMNDIYEQYVQALIGTERLYEEDVILLERELMPLMLADGHYDNKLTAAQIHEARTRDGRLLWKLIHILFPQNPITTPHFENLLL